MADRMSRALRTFAVKPCRCSGGCERIICVHRGMRVPWRERVGLALNRFLRAVGVADA